jgi:hypothetical protein
MAGAPKKGIFQEMHDWGKHDRVESFIYEKDPEKKKRYWDSIVGCGYFSERELEGIKRADAQARTTERHFAAVNQNLKKATEYVNTLLNQTTENGSE